MNINESYYHVNLIGIHQIAYLKFLHCGSIIGQDQISISIFTYLKVLLNIYLQPFIVGTTKGFINSEQEWKTFPLA